jgi:hypothetical protein
MKLFAILVLALPSPSLGFAPLPHRALHVNTGSAVGTATGTSMQLPFGVQPLTMSASADTSADPQVWSTGFSPKSDLLEAIQEATDIALEGLPKNGAKIDLAMVTISSLYDGQTSPSVVVPAVLSSAATYGAGIQKLVGCTTGGIISSSRNEYYGMSAEDISACVGIESEGIPGVSVVLALLPDVQLKVSLSRVHLIIHSSTQCQNNVLTFFNPTSSSDVPCPR